ncbi:MAG: glycosyltransferase [Candidatus Omnitrophota bacterium]
MRRRTAIIHDWLNGMRGGEKVLEEIIDFFPDADIFTLFLEEQHVSEKIRNHPIIVSPLNKYAFVRKRYKHFLPFFPATVEAFNLNAYDLIISSSHCVAKGIIPPPGALHVSYIHSPMRYVWDQYDAYFGREKGIKKFLIQHQISKLRNWDVMAAARVDHFIANSEFVKQRIWRYYRRDAEVIHPPVDTDFFQPTPNPGRDYFLIVSALVPYKAIQRVIEAFNRSGDALMIVGKGPEEKNLKKLAAPNIRFRSHVSAEELRSLYQHAAALVFAGIEDFGIAFVEALACGTPVLAYKKGGVLDIVTDDTGILFESQDVEDIAHALHEFKKRTFDSSRIRQHSLAFSKETFRAKFRHFIDRIR